MHAGFAAAATMGPCVVCMRRCGPGDLRCEDCGTRMHRSCIGAKKSAYPGGWLQCTDCTLRAVGIGSSGSEAARALADEWVAATGSAVAEGSAGVYATGRRRYVGFCSKVLNLSEAAALPPGKKGDLNPHAVCLFLMQASQRLAYKTLQGNISALADWQRSKGRSGEDLISQHPLVRRTMATLQRGSGGSQQKASLPISLLRRLIAWLAQTAGLQPNRAEECSRDACWLALGFFGMLRRSELAGLALADVSQQKAEGPVTLTVRRSKTDQQGLGAQVQLAATTQGSKVPIGRIVSRYVAWRRAAGGQDEDPLFTAVGRVRGGLARDWYTKRLRSLLLVLWESEAAGGLDANAFSSHSLRRGGATTAANAGVPLEDIQEHGRWKSDAVRLYIKKSGLEKRRTTERM